MVAQPSTGFLNVRYQPDGSPTEDTEDCLGRITVGLTRSKSLTLVVSPLDMMGLIGMAQVLAALAYGVQGLRRGLPRGTGHPSIRIQHVKTTDKLKDGPSMRPRHGFTPL